MRSGCRLSIALHPNSSAAEQRLAFTDDSGQVLGLPPNPRASN